MKRAYVQLYIAQQQHEWRKANICLNLGGYSASSACIYISECRVYIHLGKKPILLINKTFGPHTQNI